jgi:oxygen-independent coproporphyrinogen III oxidase
LIPTPDDDAADQLLLLARMLTDAGYDQYEVSNFGKPGYYSRHNSSYWRREKYLGVGPSAHSYDGETREWNVRNNSLYIKAIAAGQIPCEKEILETKDKINDYLLTSLRTQWGADLDFLKTSFNYDVRAVYKDYLKALVGDDYAVVDGNFLKLTAKGKLLADKISSDLFQVE